MCVMDGKRARGRDVNVSFISLGLSCPCTYRRIVVVLSCTHEAK